MDNNTSARFTAKLDATLEYYRETARSFDLAHKSSIISDLIIAFGILYIAPTCFYDGWYTYYLLLLAAMSLFYQFFRFFRQRNPIGYRRSLEACNGAEAQILIYFYEDHLEYVHSFKGSRTELQYSLITKARESKSYLYFITKAGRGIILDKNTIVGGTQEELLSFIFNRCPEMRNQKPTKGIPGRVMKWVVAVATILALLVSIIFFPGWNLFDRVTGRMGSYMSFQEISDGLADLDFAPASAQLVQACEEDYYELYKWDFHYSCKPGIMLSRMGEINYNSFTGSYVIPDCGVLTLCAANKCDTYTCQLILESLKELGDGELNFTGIEARREYRDSQTVISLRFEYNQTPCAVTLLPSSPRWITSLMSQICDIVEMNSNSAKQFFFAEGLLQADGIGTMLIFYRDRQWANTFQFRTGITLHDTVQRIPF